MKKFLIATLVVAAGWLAALPSQAAPVLSIVPNATSIAVGGSVTADLVISGLSSSSQIVSGFDLDVFFDPTVLLASSLTTVFAPWGTSGDVLFSQTVVAPGHVAFFLSAIPDDDALALLQGDSFVLSSISFQGLTDGFSNVSFGVDMDLERNVVGRDGLSLNQVTTGTCIAVGTGECPLIDVPEPTTLPLVLLALAASGVVVRRERSGQRSAETPAS